MSRLNDPDRAGRSSNGDTEAQKESTAHHLMFGGIVHGEALDDRADDDDDAADEHANTTSPTDQSRVR